MAIVITVIVAAGMTPAQARMSTFTSATPARLAQQDDIGASAAAAAASAASGGRVLDVKRHDSTSGVVYRVKVLLPGGRVRSLTVDGQTGQVHG